MEVTVNNDTLEQFGFELPEKSVAISNLQPGSKIKVVKNSVGYSLNANNKVVGIVPNQTGAQYFTQERQ
jgi:hypothetical protein